MNQDERSTVLPVLPLDDAVVLPGTSVTFPVTSDEQAEALDGAVEGRILLVPRIDGRFGSFGVVASVVGEVTLPDGTRGVAVEALHRAELGPAVSAEVGLQVSAHRAARPGRRRARGRGAGPRVPGRGRGGRGPARRPGPGGPLPRRHRPPGAPGRHDRLRAGDPPHHQDHAARDRGRRRAPAPGDRGPARAPRRRRPAPAHPRGREREPRQDASARCCCAASWPRSARSSARTTRPATTGPSASPGRACPRPPARRPSASSPAWSASPTAPRPG